MVTPFGLGTEACWQGLLSGATAVTGLTRFPTAHFTSRVAATVPGIAPLNDRSLVVQMLDMLMDRILAVTPRDSALILATTAGEADLLENSILSKHGNPEDSLPSRLLEKVRRATGLTGPGTVVSSACISSSAAIAHAATLISLGRADSILVVACDGVTEFVYSGFSCLMALSPSPARPFDRRRNGLSLGEAAAFLLVMSQARARREKRPVLGRLAGWGLSNDANHMTGPSRDGRGLAHAISKALSMSGRRPEDVRSISAHGTGTPYNDAMEMKAFKLVFGDSPPPPTYSIKGAVGHTLGAAGLVETIIALETMKRLTVPPSVGLSDVDDDAKGWVSGTGLSLEANSLALSTNSGFGGVNSALCLTI